MKGWLFVLLMSVCGAITLGGCRTYCDDHPFDQQCQSSTSLGPGPGGGSGTLSCDQPPSSSPVQLGISYAQQECDELCWAATISMVSQFFGRPAAQCQLASAKVQMMTGASYDCCFAGACGDPNCDQPATNQMMGTILGSALGIHGVQLDRALTELELQTELTNNRPVIVGYLGHLVATSPWSRDTCPARRRCTTSSTRGHRSATSPSPTTGFARGRANPGKYPLPIWRSAPTCVRGVRAHFVALRALL